MGNARIGGIMKKTTVVYCDDQKRFIDEFTARHGQRYDIIPVDDSCQLLGTLSDMKRLPDIVLLDLYHPREDVSDYEERRLAAEVELEKLDQQVDKTREAVLNAWEPRGLDILKQLRGKYASDELPIVMYTQRGLVLLSDDQFRLVEENSGHWLLKKALSAHTEEIRIERIISQEKGVAPGKKLCKSRELRDLLVAVAAGVVVLILSRLLS